LLDRALPDAVADLDAVLRAALVGRTEMERYLADRHDRGIVAARRALELADPRAQSRPESWLRVHLILDGLIPEVQYVVQHAGQWVATVDLAFPRHRLAVEYDGVWHGAPLQVGADRERLNRLHAAGWEVVFVTREHLRDPHRLICTVRAALQVRHAASWGLKGAQASMRPLGTGGGDGDCVVCVGGFGCPAVGGDDWGQLRRHSRSVR
ncbi:MAG: hypothetical protein WCF33_21240, partial [Pseudonocardiaceae bacterium]